MAYILLKTRQRRKKIESLGEATFNLPLMLDFFEVGREVYDIFKKPSAVFLLSGDSRFDSIWGEFKMSFAQKADLPIVLAIDSALCPEP